MGKLSPKKGGFGFERTSAVLAALLLFTAPAHAAAIATAAVSDAPVQSERLTYEIMVGGLHLGDAMITLNQNQSGYSTAMKVTAHGVAKMVKNFNSDMKGEGRFMPAATNSAGLVPQPALYSRQWSTGEIAADMTMTFDPTTGLAKSEERFFNPATSAPIAREDLPWNDRGQQQKEVPANLRTNVFDPMAAFIAARGQLMAQVMSPGAAAGRPKNFRVPIYDGRRRYDVVGHADAPRSVSIDGSEHEVIPVTAKLEPVFGFGKKTEERMRDSEAKLFFSNDKRFIPVQLVISNELLSGVMNLAADCSQNSAPCDTFGQEN
jgi:Protein of unknown function (DUF3108)